MLNWNRFVVGFLALLWMLAVASFAVAQDRAEPGSGLADIITTAGFDATCTNPKTCNQPNWTWDAKGNQTDYTYDSSHGGVLAVTLPAPVENSIAASIRCTGNSPC